MLAYDYPLLGVFWTMLFWFLWIAWIILLFYVFIDIFRSHDLGGWAKALWAIFVIFLPFLGVFVYLIARGHSMAERSVQEAKRNDAARRAYIREAAGSGSTADELDKLARLRQDGTISEQEFEQQKAKLLS
jgi:hypothetical protein